MPASETDRPSGSQDPVADFVDVARIQTTHGRHGEVAADLLTDFPERFQPGLMVLAGDGESQRQLRVASAWIHNTGRRRRVILQFEGVSTLTQAETLRGYMIRVQREQRWPLPAGQLYISDLIGCTVLEGEKSIGTIEGWQETGGVPLLRVASAKGELLVPYTSEICTAVHVDRREIRVSLPEGLLELNSANRPSRSDD